MWRTWLFVAIATLLVALVPYADASPPSSTWLPGLYDEDCDDLVAWGAGGAQSVSRGGDDVLAEVSTPLPPTADEALPTVALPRLPAAVLLSLS